MRTHTRRTGMIVCVYALAVAGWSVAQQIQKQPFTVADDIALSHFGDVYTGETEAITFSPDQKYVIVESERGLLAADRSESTLRIFRSDEIGNFVLHPQTPAKPIWILKKSSCKDGPVISHIRWMADASGFAFLLKTRSGNRQLFLADLATKGILALTPEDQDVTVFDIRDRRNLVYGVLSAAIGREASQEVSAPAIVGTGRSLPDLLFRADKYPSLMSKWHDFSDLWAVQEGKRFQVKEHTSTEPVHLYWEGLRTLSLSPDGRSIVVALAVPRVPLEWELSYLPPVASYPYRVKAGLQDLSAFDGYQYISQFVQIELAAGRVRPLTGAPTGNSGGWWHASPVAWSPSGRKVALPNTFLPDSGEHRSHAEPCVAVVDLKGNSAKCLEQLEAGDTAGAKPRREHITGVSFSGERRIMIRHAENSRSTEAKTYQQDLNGTWRLVSSISEPRPARRFDLSIKQSFTSPPVLLVSDTMTKNSRIFLDPNPQLKNIHLGDASVLRWKDQNGLDWTGGLYKPSDFVAGRRYPLVIQTHGFSEAIFEPSGAYPTGFAARELAGAGILVLQMPSCTIRMTPEEATCNLAGYHAAIEELVRQGLADENRIGIVGFSRTCFHVLGALTSESFKFRAASITDGLNFGYLEYMNYAGAYHGGLTREANAVIGAPAFGEGLRQWLISSPDFNTNKINAPLQVVANGQPGLLGMWEPYASLRLQGKPVDLLLLRGGTHVLTSPAERFASQSNTVDWFRFWLQDYDDPSPAKAGQYKRWTLMRKQSSQN